MLNDLAFYIEYLAIAVIVLILALFIAIFRRFRQVIFD